jgi:hypothetical protein
MAAGRRDIRTKGPNSDWGKDGTSNPDNDPATPQVIETATLNQSQANLDYLTPHPIASSALLLEQNSEPGDNAVKSTRRKFVTIPSTPLSDFRIDPEADGAITQEVRQDILQTSSAPSISFLTLGYVDKDLDAHIMERSLRVLYNAAAFPLISWSEYDPDTGGLPPMSSKRVAAATSGQSLQTNGTYTEIEKIDKWASRQLTKTVTTKTSGVGTAGPASYPRTYHQFRHVPLPRVLTTFTPVIFDDSNGNIVYAAFYADLTDYSGNHDVTVVEDWQSTAFTGLSASPLIGTAFDWITPFGGGGIPECLHPSLTVTATCSANTVPAGYGRYYDAIAVNWNSPATSPASLSGNIVLMDTQEPHVGGCRRRTETITI